MIGKVHKQQPLTFTSRIGEAKFPSGKVEVLTTEPTHQPMIVHKDGRCFILEWGDILKLANEAFEEDAKQ